MSKNQENQKLVPAIRFKGFTDNWEQHKLGEISKIVGGGLLVLQKSSIGMVILTGTRQLKLVHKDMYKIVRKKLPMQG